MSAINNPSISQGQNQDIYINRELQSEGMTVHMSADCVSHDNVIAVFQTAFFPAGDESSFLCFRSGPATA